MDLEVHWSDCSKTRNEREPTHRDIVLECACRQCTELEVSRLVAAIGTAIQKWFPAEQNWAPDAKPELLSLLAERQGDLADLEAEYRDLVRGFNGEVNYFNDLLQDERHRSGQAALSAEQLVQELDRIDFKSICRALMVGADLKRKGRNPLVIRSVVPQRTESGRRAAADLERKAR
ncbi:MAG: hypothetical protein M1826_000276 [Phylliscum demangeonii]|nr:MAG: hypothetical protein M1826_000276 [Phylliscum demangeonii]